MSLPSQTGRNSSRRSHMFRRKRLSRRPFVLVSLIVIGAGIIWWGPWRGESETTSTDDSITGATESRSAQDDRPASRIPTPPNEENRTLTVTGPSTPAVSPLSSTERPDPAVAASDLQPEEYPADPSPSVAIPEPTLPEPDPYPSPYPDPHPEALRPVLLLMEEGFAALEQDDPLRGRRLLSDALDTGILPLREQDRVRRRLMKVNDRLVFSPEIIPGDLFARAYAIQKNDALSTVPRKNDLAVDWRLLQRINRIPNPERIRLGQSIKLITGPFHAVISKREFRMDIYLGDGAERVFVCSFPVGLGEYNGTPEGIFKVRRNSRLSNPEWVNPRTGQRFGKDDPLNPIGEHWIGLEGLSESVKDLTGYGIHGTIDPDSIGRNLSMGCIRLLPEDIELVYELLTARASVIEIR